MCTCILEITSLFLYYMWYIHVIKCVTLNIISTLVMLLLEATAKEKNEGGGKNGWKLPSRVWRGEVGA